MATRNFTTIATTLRPRSLLETIRRLLFGPEKKSNLYLQSLPLLPLPYNSPELTRSVSSRPPFPTAIPSSIIANRFRETMNQRPKELLDALLVDFATKEEFVSRLDYFEERYGILLVSAAAPKAREIGLIVCLILGKPTRTLAVNSPLINRREFAHAVMNGFPSKTNLADVGRLTSYISPFMTLEDLSAHLPSQSGLQNADARQTLNYNIHKISLNLAITAVLGLEMAERHYGASPLITSTVLKRNVQFLLRTPDFGAIPDHLMERGDEDLQTLSEEIYSSYDEGDGSIFRSCVQKWQLEVEEEKEQKEVALLKSRLKKVLKEKQQDILED